MTFPLPTWPLGPLDVFASPAELRAALGGSVTGAAHDRRLALALLVGTRHVLYALGYSDTPSRPVFVLDRDRLDDYAVGLGTPDDTLPPDPADLVVVAQSVRPAWRQATIAAAVRFYKSPDVPFGVAGGWDVATYVRQSIPDVDMMLIGERVAFGIA